MLDDATCKPNVCDMCAITEILCEICWPRISSMGRWQVNLVFKAVYKWVPFLLTFKSLAILNSFAGFDFSAACERNGVLVSSFVNSSVSGKDAPSPALWLATRAGKIAPSCPLGTTRCVPQENSGVFFPNNKSLCGQACSAKMAGNIGLVIRIRA